MKAIEKCLEAKVLKRREDENDGQAPERSPSIPMLAVKPIFTVITPMVFSLDGMEGRKVTAAWRLLAFMCGFLAFQ